MYDSIADTRPAGLRRRSLPAGTELWRVDTVPTESWSWTGFATPRHRFDSAAGAFRTRYAGTSLRGALRERYFASGRYIPDDHHHHVLVHLTTNRPFRVLDLRTEANLDALGIDDRISTSHEPAVWRFGHRLADQARRWWPQLDGIVYRSRTTPTTSINVAFFAAVAFEIEARPFVASGADLDDLVLHDQFTIGFDYGAEPV